MNAIEPLSLSKLTTGQLQNTSTMLISIIDPLAVDHPLIARQVSIIQNAVNTLVEIDRTPRGSELTEVINADDADVDSIIPMVINNLNSSIEMKRFNRKKGEAAEALLKLIEKRNRKQLLHGGWVNQEKEVTALIADIFDPANDEIRADAGVEPMLIVLKEKFESLQNNLKLRLNEGNLPSNTKEQKKILRYRLDRLLSYIDVNMVDGVDGFEVLRTPVNELIISVMSEYRAKATRKAHSNN